MTKFHVMDNLHLRWRQDRPWLWLCLLAALVNIGDWAAMIRLSQSSETFAPLHYTIYFGTDLSFGPHRLLLVAGLGTFILAVHVVASLLVDESLWRRTWAVTALVLNILLLAATAALFYVIRTSL